MKIDTELPQAKIAFLEDSKTVIFFNKNQGVKKCTIPREKSSVKFETLLYKDLKLT